MTEQKWISVTTDVGYQAKCVLSAIPETMIQITGAKLTPQGKQYTITVSGVCAMIPDQQAGSLRVITTYGVCSCPVIMTVSGSSFSLKGANGGAIVFDPLEAGMGVKGRIEIVLETTYPYSPSAKYTGASLDYGNLADLQFSLPKNPLMGHVFTATPKLAACYEDCHVKLIIEEIPEGKKGEVLYREEFHWDPKTTHKERCSLGFGADTHSLAYAQKRRDKAMQVRIYGGLSKDGIAYRDILQYGTYTLPMPSLDSMSLSIQRKWVQQEEHLVFFVSGAVSGIAANAPFSLECQVVWNGQNRSVLFNVQNSIQYSLTETGTLA